MKNCWLIDISRILELNSCGFVWCWIFGFQSIFERFDKDRSGRIDTNELRDALMSLGFSVSPVVLDLLVSKFDKSGGRNRAIEYDNFIEYV